MNYQHKELAAGRWENLTFIEQIANIGNEVERAIKWKNKNNPDYCEKAFHRALELIDLTLNCEKKFSRLKEIARAREMLVDYFAYDNQYQSSESSWHKYFYQFNFVAGLTRFASPPS